MPIQVGRTYAHSKISVLIFFSWVTVVFQVEEKIFTDEDFVAYLCSTNF